nr:MAG TPA: hypothetical protein [Caudoviricetes sp.]
MVCDCHFQPYRIILWVDLMNFGNFDTVAPENLHKILSITPKRHHLQSFIKLLNTSFASCLCLPAWMGLSLIRDKFCPEMITTHLKRPCPTCCGFNSGEYRYTTA